MSATSGSQIAHNSSLADRYDGYQQCRDRTKQFKQTSPRPRSLAIAVDEFVLEHPVVRVAHDQLAGTSLRGVHACHSPRFAKRLAADPLDRLR
jgi:hypothetical protein